MKRKNNEVGNFEFLSGSETKSFHRHQKSSISHWNLIGGWWVFLRRQWESYKSQIDLIGQQPSHCPFIENSKMIPHRIRHIHGQRWRDQFWPQQRYQMLIMVSVMDIKWIPSGDHSALLIWMLSRNAFVPVPLLVVPCTLQHGPWLTKGFSWKKKICVPIFDQTGLYTYLWPNRSA